MPSASRSPHANFAATIYARPAGATCTSRSAIRAAAMSPSSAASRRRSGPTARSQIARALGVPLKIAAKVDKVDRGIFPRRDRAAARRPGRRVHRRDQRAPEDANFSARRSALLFPIDWPEPFGLVMIEAMACGTPVLAFRCGSVPEIIDDGVTGAHCRHHGRGDRGVAASDGARSPQGAAAIRGTIFRRAHGEGLCEGLSFAAQVAQRAERPQRSRYVLAGSAWKPRRRTRSHEDLCRLRPTSSATLRSTISSLKLRSTFRRPGLDAAAPDAQA